MFQGRSNILFAVVVAISVKCDVFKSLDINLFSIVPDVFCEGLFYAFSDSKYHFFCVDIINFSRKEFHLFSSTYCFDKNDKSFFKYGYFNSYNRGFSFSSNKHVHSFFSKEQRSIVRYYYKQLSIHCSGYFFNEC